MNRAEEQMRARIKSWLKMEEEEGEWMSLSTIEDLLYRFELYLGECEERRQRA